MFIGKGAARNLLSVEDHLMTSNDIACDRISALWENDERARSFLKHEHTRLLAIMAHDLNQPHMKNDAMSTFDESKRFLIETAKRLFGESSVSLACIALDLR